MMTLDEIALRTSTDKSSRFHNYCEYYDHLLSPIRDQPVRLLEIGILGGDSLLCWSQYFTHRLTNIVGVDIHDRNFQCEDFRVHTIYGDAGDGAFLKSLGGPWSIVIDDGSHFASHQIAAFAILWDKIAPGGLYIVEDVHTIHSQQHCDSSHNIMMYFEHWMENMQDLRGAGGCANWAAQSSGLIPESIEVRSGLIIVRKRA